jgi:hypothetical protein
MSMIFKCKKKKLHFYKFNGSWVLPVKLNVNFNCVNRPLCSSVWIVAKVILLKVCHPLKICWHTKCYGPTFSGASFAFTSEVWRLQFWNDWSNSIQNYGVEVTLNGMTSLLNFIKICQLVQMLMQGTHRHRQVGDIISLLFSLGRK